MADDETRELDALLPGVRRLAPAAVRRVYEMLADRLNTFAYDMLRDRGAAEDVVQQAFLELVTAADGIRGDGRSLRAWLFRSVRFSCLDEVRRRTRRPLSLVADPPELAHEDAYETGMTPELVEALDALTPQQRAIVYLRHVVGMSGAEVASVLGVNRAAVFASGGRAERRLRGMLDGGDGQ